MGKKIKMASALVVGIFAAGMLFAQEVNLNRLFVKVEEWQQNAKIAEGIVSPDGTNKSVQLARKATGDFGNQLRTWDFDVKANASYTFSVYAKAGTPGAKLYLRFLAAEKPDSKSDDIHVAFNLENGTVSYGGTLFKAAIEPKENGWYICSITGTALDGPNQLLDIGVTSKGVCGGNEGDFIYVWNVRLEEGAMVSSYKVLAGEASNVKVEKTASSNDVNASAVTAVKLAGIFGDHMVLQRDMEVPVWGWAGKGEKVTVEIQGVVKTVKASDWGKWMVKVGPFKAGGPCEMKITGNNVVTIKDIMIGDIWICSGQSNMQWGLKQMSDAATEVPKANYPDIRLTTITGSSIQPQDNVVCQWGQCSPQTVENFSAVGYYFGRDLYNSLKVPIGLIATAEGGSLIRTWISSKMQRSNPVFETLFKDYRTYSSRAAEHSKKLKVWEEEAKIAKEQGKPAPGGYPPFYEGNAQSPGMLYNARIRPLAPFAIKGIVWYQGEYDAMFKNSGTYCDHFSLMIQDWRDLWKQGDFPFLFVQLPWLTSGQEPVEWAEVRDAQRRTLKVKNTGMAVSTDICEPELHPRKKSELGKRLTLLARSIAYGEKLVCSGPLFDKVEFKEGKAVISFTEIGSGLVLKGDKLQGFSLAGSNKLFVKAEAEIQGKQVLVHSDKVSDPKSVRYAWADNPVGTLYNQEGFPTSCFRTDDW